MNRPTSFAMLAAAALALVGALHLHWAMGGHLPASDETSLARVVTGDDVMPPAGASLVVGLGLLAAATLTLVARRHRVLTVLAATLAAGLLLRAVVPVDLLMDALRLPEPDDAFRNADLVLYRPLCAVLAALITTDLVVGRRRDRTRGDV